MDYFAHSLPDRPKSEWQQLAEHLRSTADRASRNAEKFGAGRAAKLAGLLHDLGKYTAEFQKRLEGGDAVDHATAGAREAMALAAQPRDKLIAEIVAHAIAGHHAGLPDSVGAASLEERVGKKLHALDPVWREEIAPVADGLIKQSFKAGASRQTLAFQLAFFGRMIFSCLVDADFRDTEAFYDRAEGRSSPREWRALPDIVDALRGRFDEHMAKLGARAEATPVNALRAEVLAHTRKQADLPRGLFTLSVPTGGGKTLASLAFALDHAKRHGMERIVYAIPFTSIIDQTAAIFQSVLQDREDIVLEHHSSIDEERNQDRSSREKLKLAMEDWAAPVIVTTNVQLFESLHADRPSRCRRLHNLANSVIILDEAQTIPLHVLRPCLAALNELALNYGASIVLCTATQPAVRKVDFEDGLDLPPERELAPDPQRLHRQLQRVRVEKLGVLDDDALVGQLGESSQGLVIVNSRAHALALYRKARDAGLDGAVHLSTRQCAAHRRDILAHVRETLKSEKPCRVIATSLVEAGVDLDFPRVWRAEAGLDQIAQAAGRCNREGQRKIDESIVGIFQSPDFPPPREIRQFAEDMKRVRRDDLLSPEAIREYFAEVYWRKGEKQLDKFEVMDAWLLPLDKPNFNYRSIGRSFRMIESGMTPVIIPWDASAQEAVKNLAFETIPSGRLARLLQPYIVQTPPSARRLLLENGHVAFVHPKLRGDQFAVLERSSDFYKPDVGLLWEDADYLGQEQWLVV
ncbi:CRISPR-associated helicase/endonuclease Cas3 [Methylocystis parvus]|uniref:CRISPR-associated helicase/endonuclease Cas3 n=1 Tax=Methylocystis parvus TaxID=134 RepID=A0A6B8M6N3_9HYPH|nr:CRISPR-associated helicase/endonuclease Cas3 [Methylocystis parvus]QGM98096.1 CRISPR-associated helicase/endonuclease Cas3 [Methylocystis parvus]WBK01583.1 CRISPR-associated helicase/endonuclease Cas3 [Methylocystis parvus OBBP]